MKNHFRIYNDLWYPKAHPYVTNLILKYLIGVGELIRKNALKGSWGGRGGVIMKKIGKYWSRKAKCRPQRHLWLVWGRGIAQASK